MITSIICRTELRQPSFCWIAPLADTSRPTSESRCWPDLDDETLNTKVREITERIPQIDTFSRPHLMAQHVSYGG